jgi:hypothetical protein
MPRCFLEGNTAAMKIRGLEWRSSAIAGRGAASMAEQRNAREDHHAPHIRARRGFVNGQSGAT